MPIAAHLAMLASGCRSFEGFRAAKGESGTWELFLPWSETSHPTSLMKIRWTVSGHHQGTWRGSRLLNVPQVVRLRVREQGDPDTWRAQINLEDPDAPKLWQWSLWQYGSLLDQGDVTFEDHMVLGFSIPRKKQDDLWLFVTAPGTELFVPSAVAFPPAWRQRGTVSTVVFRERIEVVWSTGHPTNVPVQVQNAQNELLGEALVALPKGKGSLFIYPEQSWPKEILLDIGMLLPEKAHLFAADLGDD